MEEKNALPLNEGTIEGNMSTFKLPNGLGKRDEKSKPASLLLLAVRGDLSIQG